MNYDNYASSSESGVVTGQHNEACDYDTAIAGGLYNIIGDTRASGGDASDSFIGGGYMNAIAGNESFILGGYDNAVSAGMAGIGAGVCNSVSGSGSFLGGGGTFVGSDGCDGFLNQISGEDAFLGGGDDNSIAADFGMIGSGNGNSITSTGNAAVLGGGQYNSLSGGNAVLGGGEENVVSGDWGALVGGQNNAIRAGATAAVLVGGANNLVSGQKGMVGGGENNGAEGSLSTVPGGYKNIASGNESFAAGSQAEARYVGSFVWSDYVSTEKAQTDSHAGEFVARASGGVYFFSNAASSAGVHLASGSGSWSSLSDRNAKTDIVPLDDDAILAKVSELPVSTWSYNTEHGVRHVGPMAQDFYAAFGVGEDDRHITSIDEDGVALAAIKALNAKLASKDRELERREERKDREIAALSADVHHLDAAVAQLERRR